MVAWAGFDDREPAWMGEREVLLDEREREQDWRDDERESERYESYASESVGAPE